MLTRSFRHFLTLLLALTILAQAAHAQQQDASQQKPDPRAQSLRKIAAKLEIGPGNVIADIGAGKGRDTWIFADVVGSSGKVYAEEIVENLTKAIEGEATRRELSQVQPIIGTATDPMLPPAVVDMAFMHYVYHHVSQPKEMLAAIMKSLKPGGYFVIVDKRRGTLVDWGPRADRGKKHFWIAETTVVRDLREAGYLFAGFVEDCWHDKDVFALVFQRPAELVDGDPDAASAIPAEVAKSLLPPAGEKYERVVTVALEQGRTLIAPILEATGAEAVDIVLEEWATQKDERPSLSEGVEIPQPLTEQGDPKLGDEPINAVYFLDAYHRLFHGPVLLEKLHERLTDDGVVYVLDRCSSEVIEHREASHRRMIAPQTVIEEMTAAGFKLLEKKPNPTADRFLLVFGKAAEDE